MGCGFFPLRNSIFPVSGIFSASTWYFFRFQYFSRFRGIFFASAKSIILASERFFPASNRNYSRCEEDFFPLRRGVWISTSGKQNTTKAIKQASKKKEKQQRNSNAKQASGTSKYKQKHANRLVTSEAKRDAAKEGIKRSTQETKQGKQPNVRSNQATK